MRYFSLFFTLALIVFITQTHADETVDDGDCFSFDCDATEANYHPICGGLDADSSVGFVNECALRIYNCQHQTEWVVQTEVECEVAFSDSVKVDKV